MFKRLVENSRWNLPIVHHKNIEEKEQVMKGTTLIGENKYYFSDDVSKGKFSNGRQSKDLLGNNIMHHIFYIKDIA